ncbi:MAG: 3-hydroxybutyryl-CoA dehydrogenase [Bdellovibrionales bacterium]|nr:3-hydroxybutyryl-CoA dehydrogenase [Bdellovibrionales bacterium]
MNFQRIGVLGAGQMGSGIAQLVASYKIPVILVDVQKPALDKGLNAISGSLDRMIKKGTSSEGDKQSILSLIQTSTSKDPLRECDLVIEAATENIQLKQKIFTELDQICSASTLLCTNTSSISITHLAASTCRPEKVVGMHFMNPVPIMKLVEGIRGLQTSKESFEKVKSLAEYLGKTFVESNDYPGFIVNRILMPMINEAIYALYENVANKEDIDNAMKLGTNQPMGPLTLADFIGLDTCLAIMQVLHEGLGDSKYRPCPLLIKYVEAGWLGKKVGKGFYSYT